MLSSLAIAAVALYLGLCAPLFVFQRQMLFLPSGTRVDARSTDFELVNEGLHLRGWRCLKLQWKDRP